MMLVQFRRISAAAVLVGMLVAVGGCHARPSAIAWQNSTIDALLDGNYDGDVAFAEVRKHGDFGLGTFDALDGEMLAVDSTFYRVRSDGEVFGVDPKQRTPFAVVTFFRPQKRCDLRGPMSYADVQDQLDDLRDIMREHTGRAYAIRIRGTFDVVRTRSVPPQHRPYPPLADAAKRQSTFDLKNVRGTLVGFWFPESMRHVNVPGYHFHFITEDGKAGGHVLSLMLQSGVAEAQELSAVHVELPSRAPTTRPTTAPIGELEAVEK
jgi:acetolactate decarboxylase